MLDNNTSKIYRCIFAKRESRYAVARAICYGQKGETRKRYTDSQEEQLGALGLVTNAVVLWMTLAPLFFCGAERQLLFQKNKGNALVTKPGCDSAHIRHIPAKAIDGMNQKRITRS